MKASASDTNRGFGCHTAVTLRAVVQVGAPYDPTCYTEAGCGAAEYGALWAKLNGAPSSAPSSARAVPAFCTAPPSSATADGC